MTYTKPSLNPVLFAIFGSIISYSFSSYAADIDVFSDTNYYDSTDNVVTSPNTDPDNNPIIDAGNYDDYITFGNSTPSDLITISGFSASPFVLQGQSIFINPLAIDVASPQELQINGTLINDAHTSSDITDLSKIILRINNYDDGNEQHNGNLNLISSIMLGDLYMDNNATLTSGNNDVTINLYGDISFLGDAYILHDAEMNIKQMGQGSITSSQMLAISGTYFSTDVTLNNSGTLAIKSNSTQFQNVNNDGYIQTSKNTTFQGTVTNSGYASLNTSDNTTFNGQVFNQDSAVITTTGTTAFQGTVTNSDNAQFITQGATQFLDTFNNTDQGELYAKNATFSIVNNSGSAYVETVDSQFTTFNNNDSATLHIENSATGTFNNNNQASIYIDSGTVNGTINNKNSANIKTSNAILNGSINNTDSAAITTTGNTTFANNVNNNGSAKITTNGVVTFNEINNSNFATITTNGTANFNDDITNNNNAQITTNNTTGFYGAVSNKQNSKINTNGTTDFYKSFTNSDHGEITIAGTTVFHDTFSNDTASSLNIRGITTFEQDVTNTGHSSSIYPTINIGKQTTFNGNLSNGLYARILVNDTTHFSSVTNEGNITTNAYSDFSGTFNNQNNFTANNDVAFNNNVINSASATMTLNSSSTFNNDVSNAGQININGNGNFQQSFTNSGDFYATNNVTFAQNITNDGYMSFNNAVNFDGPVTNNSTLTAQDNVNIAGTINNSANATMTINKINFNNSSATLTNDGTLNLTDATLSNQLINNATGYFYLKGLTTLNNDWFSSGNMSIAPNSTLQLDNHKLTYAGSNALNLSNGSSVVFNVNQDSQTNGGILGNVKLNGNVSLNPVFAYGVTDGTYNFIVGTVDDSNGTWIDYDNNLLYNISVENNSSLTYKKKTSDEITSSLNIDDNQAKTLDAVMSSDSDNASFNQVAENISTLLQSTDTAQKQKALDLVEAITPETSPMTQQVAAQISGEVFDVVGARLAHRPSPQYRGKHRGLSSGDNIFETGAMWVQGMGSKAELKDTDKLRGFEATTAGMAMGFEKQANDNIRVGLGYAYSQTEIDSDIRNADVSTHSAIFYSEYKHPRFFMNVIANYGWSDYDESNLAASADYVVESLGMQAMIGYYGLTNGVVRLLPEAGVRYIHTKQHEYTNSIGVTYDNTSNDVFTGIVGARITAIGGNANGLKIIPEAKIAFTYDIENGEDNETLVTLPNGASYTVHGKGLNRFGIEVGAGITAEINDKVDLSVTYEGRFRKDYSDHTGMVKGQYKF